MDDWQFIPEESGDLPVSFRDAESGWDLFCPFYEEATGDCSQRCVPVDKGVVTSKREEIWE